MRAVAIVDEAGRGGDIFDGVRNGKRLSAGREEYNARRCGLVVLVVAVL